MPVIPYIGVVFSFMRSLSFLFLDDFEENPNIYVAMKSGFTICWLVCTHLQSPDSAGRVDTGRAEQVGIDFVPIK